MLVAQMRVALINTNRMRPPISPIGLEYVAEAVARDRHPLDILDLCFEVEWEAALRRFFARDEYDVVGVSFRNTDDCAFTNRHSFIADGAAVVRGIRDCSGATIVLGGVGFSTMPLQLVERLGGDAGIFGDGELAFCEMLRRMDAEERWQETPGLIWRAGATWRANPREIRPLNELPTMTRAFFDNRRYFREGGQLGFETKRGCPMGCVYCADPVAKGRTVMLRPAAAVCDELESLLCSGIDHFHTCDCEFNLPIAHALDVCDEMIRRGIGERATWYAYCSPTPFTQALAHKMKRAGCAGINFGVDSGDDAVLAGLNRHHRSQDILAVSDMCRAAGLTTMFDLLIGAPGETNESIKRTIALAKRAAPDRVGVALGVRVYPGTPLEKSVMTAPPKEGVVLGGAPLDPTFFVAPEVARTAPELLSRLIGDDPRFLFFDTSSPEKNYNYNANTVLEEAIAGGMRGAYWDILRRLDDRDPP